ncbi:MAG TPA: hypothetical protein DEH78_30475 [Solibacterales bacterium]|nr:hypothetical protein [Bryobacterales bacterium]
MVSRFSLPLRVLGMSVSAAAQPSLAVAHSANTVELPSFSVSYLAPASVTGASASLVEMDLRPGSEPPPHRHTREDEAFYILDGSLEVRAGNQLFSGRRGDFVFLPKNLPHTFAVRSSHARILLFVSPGGFEHFFARMSPESAAEFGLEFLPDTAVSGPQPMAFVNRVAPGSAYWYATHLLTFLAGSRQTEGRYALMQATAHRGLEPPPHVHENEDEFFYMLNGVAEFKVADQELHATPGSCVYLPKRVPHSFQLLTPTATALIMATPGGIEEFFMQFSRPAPKLEVPPLGDLPPGYAAQLDRMTREGAKYGLRFV